VPAGALPVATAIGRSAGRRPIAAYRFGRGPTVVALVGGVHGGYEGNSVALAGRFVDFFHFNPGQLPAAITLLIVPDANPDGTALAAEVTGTPPFAARFNANGVDLNRNWDCRWSAEAFWRDQPVPAGSEPFSEPETQALRDYLLDAGPALVIFLHSAAGGVFASGCPDADSASLALAEQYGAAAGYPVYPAFDFYPITGDAGDWLTTQGIPSFAVELTTHDALEWEQNAAGLLDVLAMLAGETDPAQ
jgi:hypothetical protein